MICKWWDFNIYVSLWEGITPFFHQSTAQLDNGHWMTRLHQVFLAAPK
jgi:hypothetical protein